MYSGPLICGFFSVTTYYGTTQSSVGLIHRCGTSDRDGFSTEWWSGSPHPHCCSRVNSNYFPCNSKLFSLNS